MKVQGIFSRRSVALIVAFIIAAGLCAAPASAQAQQITEARTRLIPPSSDQPTTWPVFLSEAGELRSISLEEVLARTLAKNLDIRIERYSEAIASDGLEGARGIYDPTLTSSLNWSNITSQSTVDPGSGFFGTNTQIDQRSGEAGVQQLLATGAVVGVGTASSRTSIDMGFNSPSKAIYIREYSIFINQPLLKGFGPAFTNSGIAIAGKQHEIARERFRAQVQRQVADVMRLYWDLVFAISQAEVQETALAQAKRLLEDNKLREEVGSGRRMEVFIAEAGVADLTSLLINAKTRIRATQDQLKKLMGLEGERAAWEANLAPQDKPQLVEYPLSLELFIDEALAHNPDWRQLQLNQEILKINERVAKNLKRPQLDLFSRYSWAGAAGGHSNADDSARTGDFDNRIFGLEFSYPLWNRSSRQAHRQSQKIVDQGETSLINFQDLLIQQVRNAARDIQTARDLTESNAIAVPAQEAKLNDANIIKEAGMTFTSQDLLRFQTDLANARTNYLRSIVSYQQAIITLELAKGTLLDTLGIKIEEVSPIDY